MSVSYYILTLPPRKETFIHTADGRHDTNDDDRHQNSAQLDNHHIATHYVTTEVCAVTHDPITGFKFVSLEVKNSCKMQRLLNSGMAACSKISLR
jgi:ABC-type nickel/cobalt efflux system permease component RcnA